MSTQKLIAFIPNLLFGLTLAHPLPTVAITPATVGEFFIPSLPQTEFIVPIIYYSGRNDRPEPGFYHQSILLQKATINYKNSKLFSYGIEDDDQKQFIFNLEDFQY